MAISQNFPDVRASLNLNFARSKTLDPRITFERASIGTYVDENGLIKTAAADEARFDHDPVTGESLGLLIEESRTNLFTYSEQFDNNGAWSKSNSTINPNTTVSPDGTQTADTLTINTGVTYGRIYRQNLGLASNVYTLSYYLKNTVKQGTHSIEFYDSSLNVFVAIPSGILGESNPEWRRFTATVDCSASGLSGLDDIRLNFRPLPSPSDGTNTVDIWGLQLEAGSFPTSYIPTSGSTVTRQPDNAQITGTNFTDFYNQNEGTWLCNFDYKGNNTSGSSTLYSTALDQSDRNWLRINYTTGTPNTIRQAINSDTDDSEITVNSNTLNKISQAYASGDQSVYINGSVAIESTRGISTNHATLDIGNIVWSKGLNQTIITGYINKLSYYPERLTNDQLQNLTK